MDGSVASSAACATLTALRMALISSASLHTRSLPTTWVASGHSAAPAMSFTLRKFQDAHVQRFDADAFALQPQRPAGFQEDLIPIGRVLPVRERP